MTLRESIRATAFGLLLLASAVAGSVSVAGAASVGATPTASAQTATDLVDCQVTGECPTPEAESDLNGSGAGIDVLVDGSHRGSTMPAFVSLLDDRGFDVDVKQSGSGGGRTTWEGGEGLSGYDVVVIPVPERPYTDAELDALDAYVRDGGALFVVGDWTGPLQGNAEPINDVIDPYGLQFNGESAAWLRNIHDPTNSTVEGADWRIALHNTVDHPITEGIGAVEYDGVSLNVTDAPNGTQAPLLYGDSDTYEFTYSTTEAEYHRGKRIVGAAAAWNIGQNGRVVAFGSQKTLTSYITDAWQRKHTRTDSRQFALRTTRWLAGAGHLPKPAKPVVERGLTIDGGETPANESIVLRNREVAFAIGTETTGAFGALPGGIYDAAAYGTSEDRLALSEVAANDFGAWIDYTAFETSNASADGRAVVTATGHVEDAPAVEATTRYVLAANASHVWVNTTLTNTGDQPYPANASQHLRSGLAVSSDGLSTWLPGIGVNEQDRYDGPTAESLLEPWAALTGERTTYGVWGTTDAFEVYTASANWVDLWTEHRLDAGESQRLAFAFYADASGGTDHFSEYYADRHGKSLGTVTGTVESDAGNAVARPTVTASKDGREYTATVGTARGTYSLRLPPGEYTLQASATDVSSSDSKTVTVAANERSTVRFDSLEGPAPVNVTAKLEADGETTFTDARVVVETATGSTVETAYTEPTPVGRETLRLPPGNYTLTFNHGTNYIAEPVTKNVTVSAGQSVNVTATLTETLDPSERDWIGVDSHAHTSVSFDGMTPPAQLLAVQLSAGVDLPFVSDHNAIGAWDPISTQADTRNRTLVPSEEITTSDLGHFNAYPLDGDQPIDATGTVLEFITESRHRHNATVFQINHPGDRFVDLATAPGQQDSYLPRIDAVEAYNGVYDREDEQSVAGLFTLWNHGYRVAATGASDDHNWKDDGRRYGTPRTRAYVDGTVTPDAWASAVKAGHTYVTYGPAVEWSVADAMAGETVNVTAGSTVTASATVRNLDELAYAELITNGSVAANVSLDGTNATVERPIEIDDATDAWVTLRVVDVEGDRALTSPVWLDVTGAATTESDETEPSTTASNEATQQTTDESVRTTTARSGPGFTALVAVVALLGTALVASRRT